MLSQYIFNDGYNNLTNTSAKNIVAKQRKMHIHKLYTYNRSKQ